MLVPVLKAPAGQPGVKLVVPTGGPLARFNHGIGGLHHYALLTADIRALQAELAARDIPMLRPEPVSGAGPFLIGPVATRGVIVEYVELILSTLSGSGATP